MRAGVGLALLISEGITLLILAVCLLFREPLIRLFVTEGASRETLETGTLFLTVAAPFFPVCCLKNTMDGALRGMGAMKCFMAATFADILVRIHANGSENTAVSGALTMAPSAENPYVGAMAGECQRLSQHILDAFCASTGASSQGVYLTDSMSGINWSTIPVTIVEMGYMTNPEEDLKMASPEYQQQMVRGIADGIDAYFAE